MLVVNSLKHWTYIVLQTIICLFIIYTIYMKSIHIYSYMLVCWNCAFIHRYRVWNILHDVALASCLQKSVCHDALSYDTQDILLSIAGGKSGSVDVSITVSVAFDETYETHAGWSIAVTNRYDEYDHNYKSDLKCSYKIYMISEVTCFLT